LRTALFMNADDMRDRRPQRGEPLAKQLIVEVIPVSG
jgi:hypothetical protein